MNKFFLLLSLIPFSLKAQDLTSNSSQLNIMSFAGKYKEIKVECIGFEHDHVYGERDKPYCKLDESMIFSISMSHIASTKNFHVQFHYIFDTHTGGLDFHSDLTSQYTDEFGLKCHISEKVTNLPLGAARVSKEYNCYDSNKKLKRRMTNVFELHHLNNHKVQYIREVQNINESGRLNNNYRIFMTLVRKE